MYDFFQIFSHPLENVLDKNDPPVHESAKKKKKQ